MQNQKPELSIVIPAYNEERRLPTTLIDIVDYLDKKRITHEIIVVDDGSLDRTVEIVKKFQKIRPEIKIIEIKPNRGKGNAVRTGMLQATGEKLLFADADGAAPIEEIEKLIAELERGADLVIGSRAIYSPESKVVTHWYRKYLGRSFNFCVNILILPGIMDTQCGFKIFNRDSALFLFSKQTAPGFSFDVEILFLARKAGYKMVEVPINWTNIPGSKVNLIIDAARMLRDILKFRWIHRHIRKIRS